MGTARFLLGLLMHRSLMVAEARVNDFITHMPGAWAGMSGIAGGQLALPLSTSLSNWLA